MKSLTGLQRTLIWAVVCLGVVIACIWHLIDDSINRIIADNQCYPYQVIHIEQEILCADGRALKPGWKR